MESSVSMLGGCRESGCVSADVTEVPPPSQGPVIFPRFGNETFHLLICPLYLPVGLQVVPQSKAHGDPQFLHEPQPHLGHELWGEGGLITDCIFWDTKVMEDMMKHVFCSLEICCTCSMFGQQYFILRREYVCCP